MRQGRLVSNVNLNNSCQHIKHTADDQKYKREFVKILAQHEKLRFYQTRVAHSGDSVICVLYFLLDGIVAEVFKSLKAANSGFVNRRAIVVSQAQSSPIR